MLRHYSQSCADADILASSEIPFASAAVQRQVSRDVCRWSVSSLNSSNVNSVLCSVMD